MLLRLPVNVFVAKLYTMLSAISADGPFFMYR